MALNFPSSANSGDTYLGDNGITYLFDGSKWTAEINAVDFGAIDANIIPVANVTYSLGNVSYQWKDLYVSNDTIYLSNIALSINASGNLAVNGVVVASAELAELVSNAASQQSSLGDLIANAAAQAASIGNLQSNAATQDTSIVNLWANAGAQSSAISSLQSNAGAQSDEISGLRANIIAANAAIVTANSAVKSYVDDRITSLVNGAPAILDTLNELAVSLGNEANLNITLTNLIANVQSNVAGANAAIVTANTAMKSYVDARDTVITNAWTANAGVQADAIAGANAAIITANTAMKSYVDAQITIASNTGNITFTDTTISTTGTGTGIILNSAGDGEISMTDYVGIDNTNPGYWLHIGDANDSSGAPHRANIALNYAHGVAWVDGVPPVASNGFRGTAVFDWRYWTTGSEGNYSKNGQAYREIGLFNDGLLDNKLFAVDLDTHVFSVNTITVDRHINAANITLTSNVVAPNFLFANGVNILTTVAPSSTYSNSNVASYLVANPQAGTYSNTNTAAYLTTATINTTGNITAGNVTTSGTYTFGSIVTSGTNGNITGANVISGVTISATNFVYSANGVNILSTVAASSTYSNSNVAAYLVANPQAGTYSNSNVTAYLIAGNVSVGNVGYTVLPNIVAQFTSNVNSYGQINAQNINSGTASTTEIVATANNGTDTIFFVDLGIAGNTYNVNAPLNSLGNVIYANDAYLYAQGNTSANIGGNLAVGTSTAGRVVKIFAGGINNTSTVATFSNTGISVTGNITTSGNISVGNVVGTSPNVTVVAGSYSHTFDNTGNVTINGMGVTMPTRPAFRVYGSGVGFWSTTANVNLKGATLTVDYNQGSYFNSTSGVFTAPVAGLYQTTLIARVGSNNGLNQIGVFKNGSTSGANVAAFWEADTNTGTATHFGVTGVVKLAVGDWMSANILAGNVNFDGNDSWTITYIG